MPVSFTLFLSGGIFVPGCIPRCTLPVDSPGVVVTVTNAQTGQPVSDAVVTLSGEDYVETLTGSDGRFSGGGSGTFVLTVQAAGFKGRTMENVVVGMTPHGCYVDTEYVEVTLDPTPG
jgi:hypothetical protein